MDANKNKRGKDFSKDFLDNMKMDIDDDAMDIDGENVMNDDAVLNSILKKEESKKKK